MAKLEKGDELKAPSVKTSKNLNEALKFQIPENLEQKYNDLMAFMAPENYNILESYKKRTLEIVEDAMLNSKDLKEKEFVLDTVINETEKVIPKIQEAKNIYSRQFRSAFNFESSAA